MKTTTHFIIVLLLFCFNVNLSHAQNADEHKADRELLLTMLNEIEKAINEKNIATIKNYIHSNAIITFHDAKVARGPAALEAYFDEKLGGKSAVLKSFSTKATVDSPADFYGNTAIAHGHTIDQFVFATGNEFELKSHWSVSLVKDNDKWLVVSLHFSVNMFDNPLLNKSKNNLMLFSAISFILGLLLMFFISRRLQKK